MQQIRGEHNCHAILTLQHPQCEPHAYEQLSYQLPHAAEAHVRSITEIVKQFKQDWTEELSPKNIERACHDSGMKWETINGDDERDETGDDKRGDDKRDRSDI